MSPQQEVFYPLVRWRDFRLKVFLEGIIVGVLSGSLVIAFRFFIEKAEQIRGKLLSLLANRGLLAVGLWFFLLIALAFILSFLIKKEPLASGSGIPQVKGELLGYLKMDWKRLISVKFLGGLLAIGAGLSLGREGPSIQLGAAAAKGFSRFLKRLRIEEKYLITSGASAGLAAAFSAPLAGVIFALEEIHKNFSPAILIAAMSASLTADFMAQQFFGSKTVFDIPHLSALPLNYYGYLLGLGVFAGILGSFFNWSLLKTLEIYDSFTKIPKGFKIMLPLFIGGVLGFYLPQVLGGGNHLIEFLGMNQLALQLLIVLWLTKFAFTMLSFGSGVPGGIFLPLLAIGALTGEIYVRVLEHFGLITPQYANNFIVLAMAAYFTAIVKAPVTGSVLITEMTGSFQHLFSLVTVSMVAYIVSDLLKSAPVYDSLLERFLMKEKKETANYGQQRGNKKALIEIPVTLGSFLDGKRVKDVLWPQECLLVSLKRGEKEFIPKGNTRIRAGDFIFVLIDETKMPELKTQLLKMAQESE